MKRFIKNLLDDDIFGMAAQTSFYLMFAIFPFLLFAISLLGIFHLRIGFAELSLVLPEVVTQLIEQLPESYGVGALALPLIVSLWSASNGVGALMRGVHYAVNGKRLKQGIRARLLNLAFTLGYVLAIAVPVTLSVSVPEWTSRIGAAGIIYLFIAALYAFTPGCKNARRYMVVGAAVTTLLWWLVNLAFGTLAGVIFRGNPLYGGVSAFLSAMMWIYAISVCVLFGAEINAHLAKAR